MVRNIVSQSIFTKVLFGMILWAGIICVAGGIGRLL